MAQVHAQSADSFRIRDAATQVNPNLRSKLDRLRPATGVNPRETSDRFRLFDQFRDNKPGWIEVKKDDRPFDPVINPARPSAVRTLQQLQR
jgi:hypothetical protein